jgi:hypothetical protein
MEEAYCIHLHDKTHTTQPNCTLFLAPRMTLNQQRPIKGEPVMSIDLGSSYANKLGFGDAAEWNGIAAAAAAAASSDETALHFSVAQHDDDDEMAETSTGKKKKKPKKKKKK